MGKANVPDTSTTLLRDVADSQHARWAVFYSRYQPLMRSYLRARFPAVDADDVIQETFTALAKLLPDYKYDPKKKGSFHNFLTGVLRNKALCELDSRNRKMTIEDRMKIKVTVDGKSVREQAYEDWREEVFEVVVEAERSIASSMRKRDKPQRSKFSCETSKARQIGSGMRSRFLPRISCRSFRAFIRKDESRDGLAL